MRLRDIYLIISNPQFIIIFIITIDKFLFSMAIPKIEMPTDLK
jgi:hypothetical protein